MKFTVITTEKGFLKAKEEFPHDNILIFDYNLFDGLKDISIEDNENYYKLLRLFLMRKYKNLVFIDYPNTMIVKGLRNELLTLSKTSDDLFYLNDKLDFFYSKKCIKIVKKVLKYFMAVKDISVLDNFIFFMQPKTHQMSFEHIYFYDGLKIYMETFQGKETILLLDLQKEQFNFKDYRKYITNDSTFLLCYNAQEYKPGWDFGKEAKSLLLIDFDISLLPIRYDTIKTYINVKNNISYQGYYNSIKTVEGLV